MSPTNIADLLVKHRSALVNRIRGRAGATAEDAVQDACVSLLASKKDLSEIEDVFGWMMGHVKMALRRRHRRQLVTVQGGDDLAALVRVAGNQEHSVELAEVMAIVGSLTPRTQEAFRLIAIEGRKAPEAAKIMGISRQRAHVYYTTAMTALKAVA